MKIAVVGGGISGLTAAHLLVRAGHDVTCYEPRRPGGLIRSERRDGFLCEAGPQALLDGAPEVRALIDAAGLTPRVVGPARAARRRFVYVRGRLRPVPTGPLSLLGTSLLSFGGKRRLLREPRIPAGGGGDESVLDFATRRLGAEAARDLVAPAVIGVFAGDAARLSLPAAFPRLAAMEAEHGSLLRGLRAARWSGTGMGRSISFPEGLEELPRALAERLGDRIVPARVTGVAPDGGRWRVQLELDALTYDHVILAVPPRRAAALLTALAPRAAAALQEIPLASVAVAALGFRGREVGMDLGAYGFLVARGEGPTLLGCQYESTVFPGRAPEGAVLLRVLLGGAFDPGVADQPEEDLVRRAVEGLRAVAGLRAEPDVTAVWRLREVLPQYEVGHLARARAAEEDLARLPGLHLLGTALRGVGLADCIRNATALATKLNGGTLAAPR